MWFRSQCSKPLATGTPCFPSTEPMFVFRETFCCGSTNVRTRVGSWRLRARPFQTAARYVRRAAECVHWPASRNGASISPFRDARLERVRGHDDDRARLLSPHVYLPLGTDRQRLDSQLHRGPLLGMYHPSRQRDSTRRPPSEKWCVIPQPQRAI